MLDSFRSRLTYANVMATMAVFIALGGTSYAALTITGKNVRNSSLTGADVKDSSLTGVDQKSNSIVSVDVKDGDLLAKDFKAGQLPGGAQGPQGAQGPAGTNGTNGAPGSALAYAQINADGTFDPANSKNVNDAEKFSGTGQYCIDFAVPVKNAVASLFSTSFAGAPGEIQLVPNCGSATITGEVFVLTYTSAGASADHAFHIVVN